MKQLLTLATVTQRIGAVSQPDLAAKQHEIDSAQELICQEIEKVQTAEDFMTLAKYTIDVGNNKGDRDLLYRRLKQICRVQGRAMYETIKAQPEAFAAYQELFLKNRVSNNIIVLN